MTEFTLSMRDICRITKLSRYTIYRLMKEETFPKSVKLGKRSVRWNPDEIEAWLKTRREA